MNKNRCYRPEVRSLSVLLAIVFLIAITPGLILVRADTGIDQPSEESIEEKVSLDRRIFFKDQSSFPDLPDLKLTDLANYRKSWPRKKYGVDENPHGIIGSAVVSYYFRTPRNWSVKNTSRRFASGKDMVIFRLTGESGVWGTIAKINLKDKSIENEDEFARYYSQNRPSFLALPGDLNSSEVASKLHLIQGFTDVENEFIKHYESYSSVETPRGKFVSVAGYEIKGNLGYVVDIYIPIEEFDRSTRTVAYGIGTSFKVYRFL
jgi:hypothetical protein